LACKDAEKCATFVPPAELNKLPILKAGRKEVARGSASMDPSILTYTPAPPKPWDMTKKSSVWEHLTGSSAVPGSQHIGPVRALKMKWAREDGKNFKSEGPQNERKAADHSVRGADGVVRTYRDEKAKDGVKGTYRNQCGREDFEALEQSGQELRMGQPSERWLEAAACADKSVSMFGNLNRERFTACFSATAQMSVPCSKCVAGAIAHAHEKKCESCLEGICSDGCTGCLHDYEETMKECMGRSLQEVCRPGEGH
jgi:hypothetical protein